MKPTHGRCQVQVRPKPVPKKQPRNIQVTDYEGGLRLIVRDTPRDGENWAEVSRTPSSTLSKENHHEHIEG